MSNVNADLDDSTKAVVLKHILQEPSDDVRSVRSMPLRRDDDYFYYRGDVGCEQDCHDDVDDDDDVQQQIDHIGLLIGPSTVQKSLSDSDHQHEMRSSLFSNTSDVTTPWSNNSQQEEFHYTAREYVELKLEIANLKAQLDDQKFHYKAMVSSLQERALALECENIDLRQQLKQSEGHDVSPKEAVHQVKGPLQVSPEKVEPLKENVTSREQVKNKKRTKPAILLRRRSNDDKDNITYNDEESYLPFPPARPPRRSSSSANLLHIAACGGAGRRPSLLESLRLNSFRKNSNDSLSVPNMTSSQVSSDDSDTLHYLDEINAQTGIYNQKSLSKLLELEQAMMREEEEAVMKKMKDEELNASHHTIDISSSTITSQMDTVSPSRQQQRRKEGRPPRRKTFTFGDGERPASLRHLFSKDGVQEREREFDVENELWDCYRNDKQ